MRDYRYSNWPKDRSLPTEEQYTLAATRHMTACKKALERGYQGDQLMGLAFVMATYAPAIWLPYFAEDYKEPE